MSDKEIIDKLIDLTEGTIDHFDREDAMDMLYEVKRLLGKRESNFRQKADIAFAEGCYLDHGITQVF